MPITLANHTSEAVAHTRVPPLVIAHRGASADYPENTIPAFVAAIDQGTDMLEIDVHMNADGELVVIHDVTVERTTNARVAHPDRTDYSVKSMTTAEIASLDAGSWKSESFAGVRVPHLAEVLDLVHVTRTGLLLEVKLPTQYPGFAQALVESLTASPDYLDRALAAGMLVVQSGDWAFIREFHALAPEIPVGVLGRPCPDELRDFATWVDQVNPQYIAADATFLGHVHELGMSSLVWTVDSVEDMEKAVDLGADGIITNRPDRLVAVVEDL
ncbi:glycerophosphodiester phosphodiesterase family protein [Brevibacterium aurantiacum]|uniref:Glycerophosphodiester phosphodiesterase n=1 Tax=Brevibacterium aurantiacum TaxID=273384 RepID=A0A556CC99_BREAU|nr:glycerophosphodiester phosphodiesterase family protein [Brevibacterium aurantiacum]TSI15085.1 glycerophosphodiester phosphodiesterase [Brevibacterium aurantiacum]